MSVVVTVAAAGAITVAAPILSAIAATAAATLGLKALAEVEAAQRLGADVTTSARNEARIEARVAQEAALSALVADRCTLHFGDDAVTLIVNRDIRGRLTIVAHGELPAAQLRARAEQLLGLIQQQVAYRNVVKKMKDHGFSVDAEQRLEDGTARVRLKLKR